MANTATRQSNYYKLLGVPDTATSDEITRAYRKAMKQIHPDRQSPEQRHQAEEAAKSLNVAYTTLSQPDRRRQYDNTLRAAAVQDQIMSRYTSSSFVPGEAQATRSPRDPMMAPRPQRYRTQQERQEQQKADRSATSSLFFVFGGAALFVVLAIIMFALLGAIFGGVF